MTATPQHLTEKPLDAVLAQLRLDGAIFFRSEFTEGWGYESPTAPEMAGMLHPGAERLIMFHIVAAGRCWMALDDGEKHWASHGDVVVMPYGDHHSVGGQETADVVPIATLFAPPPWQALPVIQYGAGGDRTDIVCGYLHSQHPLFNPALRALPPIFVVRPPEGPALEWVRASIDFAVASSSATQPVQPADPRLAELVFKEVLRLHLATTPAIDRGWIAALSDPVLAPALAALHAEPDRRWTVTDLAASAAVSRSVLDERFRQVLGRSPIRYLTEWRMHIAEELLAATDHGVVAVARRVGYDSEEAFSRAFKRAHGLAPGAWRAARR
ncbi:MAG TPA: AraC family transcriptional regulator [Acidimicrobiales bacterium]|jgi:AraC-like DNA-binding protein|nr:AraC family transcriptional regulator [Acidimicrobiales bacterium]